MENKLGLGGKCINDIAARDWSSDHTPNLNEEIKRLNFKTSVLYDFSWGFTQKCLAPDRQPETKETPPNPRTAW